MQSSITFTNTILISPVINRIRYIKNKERVVQPSLFKEGRYDLPDEAKKWLTFFREQNQSLLQSICVSYSVRIIV